MVQFDECDVYAIDAIWQIQAPQGPTDCECMLTHTVQQTGGAP